MIMKRLLFLFCALMTCHIFPMEPEEAGEFEQEEFCEQEGWRPVKVARIAEPETAEQKKIVEDFSQLAEFQKLPKELKIHILNFLINVLLYAPGYHEMAKLYNAAASIRAAMSTDKLLYQFVNDPEVTTYLIAQLAQLYARGDKVEAAIALGTKAAAISLNNPLLFPKLRDHFLRAARLGQAGIVKFILNYLSDDIAKSLLLCRDQNLNSALLLATESRNMQAVKVILEKAKLYPGVYMALLNRANSEGITPLMEVARSGFGAVIDDLIPHSTINVTDNLGLTALYYAALNGHAAIVQKLLDAGATDVINDAEDANGITPLIAAAIGGNFAVIETLLAVPDINVNQEDADGHTALNYVQKSNFPNKEAIIQLLLQHGAQVGSEP